jgi:anti-anti-sigma factor
MEPACYGLRIDVSRSEGYDVAVVRGEIDMLVASDLADDLRLAAQRCGGRLVLDLEGVGYMDCAGVNALLVARQATERLGGFLFVRVQSDAVRRVLELTGVEKLLTDEATVRMAMPEASFLG